MSEREVLYTVAFVVLATVLIAAGCSFHGALECEKTVRQAIEAGVDLRSHRCSL